jgi:pimeloyl-ACP methyl ester carboxylesterase
MGGGISLQIAIQYPDKVDKLVLVDSAGLGKELTIQLRLASLPIIGDLLTRPSRKRTFRFLKECVYDPSLLTDNFVERGYQIASLPGVQKAFLTTLRSCVGFGGLNNKLLGTFLDYLSNISVPVLIVWGLQDRILPVARAHVAAERIPNAKLHIFNPCGHFPQIERPEEFNTLILEFLKGAGGGTFK